MTDTVSAVAQNKATIDVSARVHPTAKIGHNVSIGAYTVIGPRVEVGDNCHIGAHVVIHSNTTLKEDNRIYSFACIGGDPQDIGYKGEETWLHIGRGNVIREYVSINRGSAKKEGTQETLIGDYNNFLAYSHVAHDCKISNHVLFVNNATIAGHVIIDDHVIVGAFSAVHQFCHIGAYTFLCRGTQVPKDVPPYMMVTGNPGYPCGLNMVGLKRCGFNLQTVRGLKNAYQLLYRNGLSLVDALEGMRLLLKDTPEVQLILDLVEGSKRGISRKDVKKIQE